MVNIDPNILIILLNENGLNTSLKGIDYQIG